jgi:hypothetical protein
LKMYADVCDSGVSNFCCSQVITGERKVFI